MKTSSPVMLVFGLAAFVVGQTALASFVILNSSFEDPSFSPGSGQYTLAVPPSWTGEGTCGVWSPAPDAFYDPVPDGSQVGFLSGAYSTPTAWIRQTLTDTLQPNTAYALTIYIGNRTDAGARTQLGYSVELYAGSDLLTSVVPEIPPVGKFIPLSATYTSPGLVTPGQLLEIRISSSFHQLDFDKVSLDAVLVPESSAWVSFSALGLAAFACCRRRPRGA